MKEYSGQTSIHIAAAPHMLYEYLSDFTRHPEWSSNLSQVTQITDGATRVGTKFKTAEGPPPVPALVKLNMMRGFIQGVLAGAKPYSIAEITALEPDRRIAWQAGIPHGDGYFNRAEWEFILEPRDGGTQLTQRFHYFPQTGAAEQMVGAAGVNGIAQACAVNLQRLKRVVEQKLANPTPVGLVQNA
jgi:hypothetical protein